MFSKADMIFKDYKWTEKVHIDNPLIINNEDQTELNRSDGSQMLFYMRCLGMTWSWKDDAIKAYQKLEKTIKTKVPSNISTYSDIKRWIQLNFKDFWDTL